MLKSIYTIVLFAIALPALAQEPESGETGEVPQQTHELNEVVVTEAPVVREAGKDSYIITPELREGTMSAAQLMRRLKGFVVDPISESVSIAKDKDIPVVVNDKEVTHKYAMSLNPERIKRIEVLRYPAGRFSGIPILINIVLNSNYIGTDGSLYATADAVLNGSATNSQSAGANVVSSFGRWSVFGTAQFEHNLQYNSRGYELHAGEAAEEVFPLPTPSQANVRIRQSAPVFVAGADYRISNRHTLSAQSILILADANMRERTRDLNTDDYDSRNSITSLFYQGQPSDRLSLNAELSYNYYDINDRFDYSLESGDAYSSSHFDGTKNYVNANGGASYSLSDRWNISAWYGYTWRDYSNRSRSADGARYYFKEQRLRPQATVSYNNGRNLSVRATAGLLHVVSDNIGNHAAHTSFMPVAQIYYAPVKKLNLLLHYGGSSSYPSLEMLSPNAVTVIKGLSTRGNPDLRAQVMHNAAAELTFLDDFKVAYSYYFGGDSWTPYYSLMPDGTAMRTNVNADYSNQYLGVSYSGRPLKHVRLNVTLNYQWQHLKADGEPRRSGRMWYADIDVNWDIAGSGWNAMAGLFVRNSHEPLLQGRKVSNVNSVSLSLQKNFLNNRLSAAVQTYFCPGLLSRRDETRVNIPGFSYKRYTDARIRAPYVGMSLSYSFGQGKSRKADNDPTYDSEK